MQCNVGPTVYCLFPHVKEAEHALAQMEEYHCFMEDKKENEAMTMMAYREL